MKKTILIIAIIGALILIGLAASNYRLLLELITGDPETITAQVVSFSGEVKKITDDNLTIISDSETFKVLIKDETELISIFLASGEDGLVRPTGKEMQLQDIKVGDRVNVSAREKKGELVGTSILVTP